MVGTPVSSRYSWVEMNGLNRRRGSKTRAQFQKEATMKRVAEPELHWGDFMGCNCGPIPSESAMRKVHELGLGWVSLSPEMGWYRDVKAAVGEVQRIHEHGLNCHVVMQVAGHDYTKVIANPNEWIAYCKAFADGGVNAMTMLCEPNNLNFWKGLDSSMHGPAYVASMAAREIRMDHPTLPIYAPGWSPAGGEFAPARAMAYFIFRMKELHMPPSIFTGPSMHPYVYNGVNFGLPDHKEWNAFAQTPDVQLAAQSLGMPGPISLSEYGVPSAGTQDVYPGEQFTEKTQAEKIQQYLDGFMAWRKFRFIDIGFMALSTAIDGDASTRPIESTMGVFRKDGSEKPAADVVRQFARKEWDLAYSA